MIVKRLARWFDERLGAARFVRTALNKVFPDHWSFMLGELALYLFVILVLTGVYLTFFFTPGSQKVVIRTALNPLPARSPISSSDSAANWLLTRSSAAPKTTDEPPAFAAGASISAAARAARNPFTPWLR